MKLLAERRNIGLGIPVNSIVLFTSSSSSGQWLLSLV